MELKQAKEYFELGIITGFSAIRAPMSSGWNLLIKGKEGREWLLETQLRKTKDFSSVDTLIRQVEVISGTSVNGASFHVDTQGKRSSS